MAYPETPPARLASRHNHADYHPCYPRVGLRVNGEERSDVIEYDRASRRVRLRDDRLFLDVEVEPYWRRPASRQERRLSERYDAKHGAPE